MGDALDSYRTISFPLHLPLRIREGPLEAASASRKPYSINNCVSFVSREEEGTRQYFPFLLTYWKNQRLTEFVAFASSDAHGPDASLNPLLNPVQQEAVQFKGQAQNLAPKVLSPSLLLAMRTRAIFL